MRCLLSLPFAVLLALGGCGAPSDSSPPPAAGTAAAVPPNQMGNRAAADAEAANPATFAPGANAASGSPGAGQGVATAAIQAQLQSFFSLAQVGMPMTGLTAVTQGQNLAQFFAPQCNVTPWPNYQPITSADDLGGEIGNWLAGMQIGKFELKKTHVKVAPDRSRGRAVILVTATLTYVDRLVTYENWYLTDWAPVQGNWLITGVTPITTSSNTKVGGTAPEIDFDPYWGPGWGYY